MGIFSLEPGLAIWTWITFGILLFLLSKFVFPTLLQNIKDRESAISQSVDNAAAIQQRLADIENEYKNVIAKGTQEADKIILTARQDAEVLKKEILEKTDLEAAKLLADARVAISEERKSAFDSMRKDIVNLVCQSSEKLIGHTFVTEKEQMWTEELIESL